MTDVVIVEDIEYVDTEIHTLANRFTEHATTSDSVNLGGSHYSVAALALDDAASNTLTTSETVTGIRRQRITVTDNVTTSDDDNDLRTLPVTDARVTSEAVTAFATMEGSETDVAVTRESVTGIVTAQPEDTATTSESVEARTVAVVTDNRVTSDSVTAVRKAQITVTDNRTVSDGDSGTRGTVESDAATTSEALAVGETHTVSDAATTAETVTAGRSTEEEVSDAATTSDAVTTTLHATTTVYDDAETAEAVNTSEDDLVGYWNNTMTGAPARWDGLPFNSMVAVNGVLYGAGEGGIYRMDDTITAKDAGANIRSEVMWDLEDFGSPNRKRIEAVYVAGQAKGPFTVRVINERGRWDYPTRLPFTHKVTQHLAQPGRGLEATHWRIALIQTKSFAADRVLVEHDNVGRRVG